MKAFLLLVSLAGLLIHTGCNGVAQSIKDDPTEAAVLSDKPMDQYDGEVTGELDQRQDQFTDGVGGEGQLNAYEEQQMDQAIGKTDSN